MQPVTIRYAVYGELNPQRDNAVLVCHALSGSARVADWWPEMFSTAHRAQERQVMRAPKRSVFDLIARLRDLRQYAGLVLRIDRANVDQSSNWPALRARLPLRRRARHRRTQAHVLDELGVQQLRTVIGASIGGMQALQWAVDYPHRVGHCIAIGTAPLSAMGLALNHLQRQAILLDPKFRGGQLSCRRGPDGGLGLARAIAMCSYKSAELFGERYARKPNRNGEDPLRSLARPFRCCRISRLSGREVCAALRRQLLPGDRKRWTPLTWRAATPRKRRH